MTDVFVVLAKQFGEPGSLEIRNWVFPTEEAANAYIDAAGSHYERVLSAPRRCPIQTGEGRLPERGELLTVTHGDDYLCLWCHDYDPTRIFPCRDLFPYGGFTASEGGGVGFAEDNHLYGVDEARALIQAWLDDGAVIVIEPHDNPDSLGIWHEEN